MSVPCTKPYRATLTNHLSFSDHSTKDLPALCKSCLGLKPIARMQQVLDRIHMAISDRNSAVKFSGSVVILLSQVFDRRAKLALNSATCLAVDMLDGTCADHNEKTCPLHTARPTLGVVIPPASIFLAEVWWVDDVVIKVDNIEKALDQGIYRC